MTSCKDKKMADPKIEIKDHTPEVPDQIKRQLAEAEAIRAEMETAPPLDESAAEPVPAAPGSEPVPPQPGVQPAAQPPVEDDQTWEQRFRSQSGRLEQAQKANQALAERMAQLESLIATMKVRGAEPEDRPNGAVPIVKPKLVSEQEAQEYGDEFLSVVGKRAREEYVPEFEALADRLKRLEGRVEGVGTVMEKSKTQELWGDLTSQVPEWRQINKHPDFISWLQQPDTFSGRRRHDLLKEAFSRHEAGRVVSFFQGFLTEATGLPPTSQAKDPSAPPLAPNGNGSGKPSLEQFAAPGRARSAPQELPPDKPIYTTAWIAKFSADKLMGKYRGREADAEAIEQDIFRAQHEGRIQ
jgi:hypothetical protein